jgi:hypothetical protein
MIHPSNSPRAEGKRVLLPGLSSERTLTIPMSMGVGCSRTIGGDW